MKRREFLQNDNCFALEFARQEGANLRRIVSKIHRAGYSEQTIAQVLQLTNPYQTQSQWQGLYQKHFLQNSVASHALITLFFLNSSCQKADLQQVLTTEEIDLLVQLGVLLNCPNGALASTVSLEPLAGRLFATDHRFEADRSTLDMGNRVMYLGADSSGLAQLAASVGGRQALDLCTGSGVIPILASGNCDQVVAVDINPRAIHFSRFNALLNGVDNVRFVEGDLFAPLEQERFDLITANPPFVPTPQVDLLYRDGGKSGEEVLSRILGGLHKHLQPGGHCLITTDLVEHADRDYTSKMDHWLGEMQGYLCAILGTPAMAPLHYAMEHHNYQGAEEESLVAWLEHYRQEQICGVRTGYILLQRDESERRCVQFVPIKDTFDPSGSFDGLAQQIFARLELVSQSHDALQLQPAAALGNVELLPPNPQLGGVQIHYAFASALLAVADQGVTMEAVVSWLAQAGYTMEEEERRALEQLLRQLFVAGYLDPA